MFGDLMGNMEHMEQQQAEMAKKLQAVPVECKVEGVTIVGNAARQVTNIVLEPSLLDSDDKEMIEDILITAFNRFIEVSSKVEAEETQKMMQDLLPPGFGDLFK
jgi:nucleoid-associated protein EbfC